MNLIVKDKSIHFRNISLTFHSRDIENIFWHKNNKTLSETLNHKRYNKLKDLTAELHQNYSNANLGDFLHSLKLVSDNSYLKFLNKYGDNRFCQFTITDHLNDKGIYCFIVEGQIKYIGRCTDNFKKRINQGYGKIHPKNCYIDGQATNCHLNSLINSSSNVELGIYIMTDKSTEEIKSLEKMILSSGTFEWNIQTK